MQPHQEFNFLYEDIWRVIYSFITYDEPCPLSFKVYDRWLCKHTEDCGYHGIYEETPEFYKIYFGDPVRKRKMKKCKWFQRLGSYFCK